MYDPRETCPHRSWIALTALIGVLAGLSFIPPQTIGGVKLRRANILSDLVSFDDAPATPAKSLLFDEEEYRIDLTEVDSLIEADTEPHRVQITFEWSPAGRDTAAFAPVVPDTAKLLARLVPIEDFDSLRTAGGFAAFCDTLLAGRRPVRIAFLGDSFVEGDIMTADLREKLQSAYGGGGAGFAPMASPLTGFRRTIKTQSKGWTAYNIMQRKAAPAHLRENFFVSGWACRPAEGASTRWESSGYRPRLGECTAARIYFISPADSRVEVVLNDSLRQEFAVEGDAAVRQIVVAAPRIGALEFGVKSGVEGFIGYGAVFEGHGVVVDNYSVRSNNGQAMFWTNPSVNAQIDALADYDLVILQYGLNIMQAGVREYSRYGAQIEKMVSYVRSCFPGAAVLVLGVSDRSVKTEEGFRPMDAIPHMLARQREAARRTGAAFWPTSDAMRALGGMERFVANGWAGKDFTHINFAGGRRVAEALFDAINASVGERYALRQSLRRSERPILDSAGMQQLGQALLTGPARAADRQIAVHPSAVAEELSAAEASSDPDADSADGHSDTGGTDPDVNRGDMGKTPSAQTAAAPGTESATDGTAGTETVADRATDSAAAGMFSDTGIASDQTALSESSAPEGTFDGEATAPNHTPARRRITTDATPAPGTEAGNAKESTTGSRTASEADPATAETPVSDVESAAVSQTGASNDSPAVVSASARSCTHRRNRTADSHNYAQQ